MEFAIRKVEDDLLMTIGENRPNYNSIEVILNGVKFYTMFSSLEAQDKLFEKLKKAGGKVEK